MLDKLSKLAGRVKGGLGDLWWYTIIMFCVQRSADVINMFIGLWLVPRYVPQSELGAVLPLAQVGNVMGLPLMIVMGPFVKFLNTYATRGEYGKVKALLRDGCLLALLIFGGIILYAKLVMPLVFVRMRVTEGRLGFLIVLSGAVAAATPIATTALQGLKRFRMVSIVGLLSAPVRLAVMLVCLPIRGLSGYFVGQTIPNIISMGMSLFGLRKILGKGVRIEPYWRKDGKRMLSYMWLYGVVVTLGVMQIAVETFVIRHRLPDLESAAFYMISRFAETGSYVGLTLVFVAFPLIAERHERGESADGILWQSIAGTLVAGLSLAVVFYFLGPYVFGFVRSWTQYLTFIPEMAVLTIVHALRLACACFFNHEMACNRFSFLPYYGLILLTEISVLYGLTGFGFFAPYLPNNWTHAISAYNPCRLDVVLGIMFFFTLLPLCVAVLHMANRKYNFLRVHFPKISVE